MTKMCRNFWRTLAAATVYPAALAWAADTAPVTGPLVESYGPVYVIPNAYGLDPAIRYRAVMDVSEGADDPAALNRSIESAARYLNMHARAGIPAAHLELAVVLHGGSGKDSLNNAAHRARFGVDNPNDEMLQALAAAGVHIYLCGQTAGFRGFKASDLHPAVQMATSAMTVLVRLQTEGWALLP